MQTIFARRTAWWRPVVASVMPCALAAKPAVPATSVARFLACDHVHRGKTLTATINEAD